MSEPRKIKIVIWKAESYSGLHQNLEDFIGDLRDALKTVPKEERATAAIFFERERGSYDESDTATLEAYYTHIETPAEVKARDDAQRQATVNAAARRIADEAATLRHLMDKYGIDAQVDVGAAIRELTGK
jgi:hypothetical protein